MTEQVLFKYRSLDSWKFFIDIVVGRRLYAAPFRELNDPMEGRYYYRGDAISRAFDRSIRESKNYWRICSLTPKATSTLMWSYYARGHTGVAVGVVVPKRSGQIVSSVRYDSDVYLGPRDLRESARSVAMRILSQKQSAWAHEGEVRVFSSKPFVDIELKSVMLGCQMPDGDRKLIEALVRKTAPNVPVRKLRSKDLDAPLERFARAPSRQAV